MLQSADSASYLIHAGLQKIDSSSFRHCSYNYFLPPSTQEGLLFLTF